MGNLFKLTQRLSADPFGRGIDSRQLRMRFFKFFQFPQQMIVLKIRHSRIIQNVITVVCLR